MKDAMRDSLFLTSNKQCSIRREDDKYKHHLDEGISAFEKNTQPLGTNPYKNYKKFGLGDSAMIETNETYIRKGYEFFIPKEVSAYLFDAAFNKVNLDFTYQDDKSIIIEPKIKKGGRRKKRTHKKRTTKRTHKKRTTKRR
jgi:hypothetical protein